MFNYPTYYLSPKEYAKIIHEINTSYELYRGKSFAVHSSVGIDNRYYQYYFENRGFNDYNIVNKIEF